MMITQIIKVQAAFRGYLARKYVKAIKESNYHQGFSYNMQNNNGELVYNYDNADVIVGALYLFITPKFRILESSWETSTSAITPRASTTTETKETWFNLKMALDTRENGKAFLII